MTEEHSQRDLQLADSYVRTEEAFINGGVTEEQWAASLIYTIALRDLPPDTLDLEPPEQQLANRDAFAARVEELRSEFITWARMIAKEMRESEDPAAQAAADHDLAIILKRLADPDLFNKVVKEGETFIAQMKLFSPEMRRTIAAGGAMKPLVGTTILPAPAGVSEDN